MAFPTAVQRPIDRVKLALDGKWATAPLPEGTLVVSSDLVRAAETAVALNAAATEAVRRRHEPLRPAANRPAQISLRASRRPPSTAAENAA